MVGVSGEKKKKIIPLVVENNQRTPEKTSNRSPEITVLKMYMKDSLKKKKKITCVDCFQSFEGKSSCRKRRDLTKE